MKRSRIAHRRNEPGAPPGTLVPDPRAKSTGVRLIAYDGEHIEELDNATVDDIASWHKQAKVLWIGIHGLGEIGPIEETGEYFGLHGLALEDVVNVHQRPKAESYDDHIYIVTRMFTAADRMTAEQLSIFLGPDYVLTFQEGPDDCFGPVRKRLRQQRGRIRISGSDYLAYSLIDAVIDGYFPVLEKVGEDVEQLEEAVLLHPEPEMIHDIHHLKHELMSLRRSIWSHREMVSVLLRDESPLIGEHTLLYLRDTYDHSIQQLDIVETYRDIASGMVDIYLSNISTRMNEIMKVLTIIATIFMPLGFIASIYGMNFDRASPWNMPELGWYLGYPFALGLMSLSVIVMLYYFWRKKWIGSRNKRKHEKLKRFHQGK